MLSWHVIALDSTGKLWGWGADDFDDNGTGAATNSPKQNSEVPGNLTFKAVGAGADAGYAVASDGTPYGWGDKQRRCGELSQRCQVHLISGGCDVGWGLDASGQAYAFGTDYTGSGIFGTGGTGPGKVVMPTEPPSNRSHPHNCDSSFTVALGGDGRVYAWGANGSGQLGDGLITVTTHPRRFTHRRASRSSTPAQEALTLWRSIRPGRFGPGVTTRRTGRHRCWPRSPHTAAYLHIRIHGPSLYQRGYVRWHRGRRLPLSRDDHYRTSGGGGGGGGQQSQWYVGLGDSYQSGEGAEGSDPQNYHPADGVVYEPPTGGDKGCHRSPDAYTTFAPKGFRGDDRVLACSGARIADVDGGPGARGEQSIKSGEDPQIQHLNKSTELLTIGVGGNDIRFVDIVTSCVCRRVTPTANARG